MHAIESQVIGGNDMNKWSRRVEEFLESWPPVLAASLAVLLGLLSFLPFIHITSDFQLRVIVIMCGLLLGTLVALTRRRAREIQELREAVGVAEIQQFEAKIRFPQELVISVRNASDFVLDTNLNEEVPGGEEDNQ